MAGRRQRGVALAVVVWMLAALSVLVAALASMSREEVSAVNTKVVSAKAYYLGKGVARLAMRDRALSLMAEAQAFSASGPDTNVGPYSAAYQFVDATVAATVFPAAGFMSIATAESDAWVQFLSQLGGMDAGVARSVVSKLDEHFESSVGNGSVLAPDTSTFGGYAQAYEGRGGQSNVFYVESLLGVEGMTRAVYDRIRRSVAPFRGAAAPNAALAPPELQAVFQQDASSESATADAPAGSSFFCVELLMDFNGADRVSQRIWVDSSDAVAGAVRLVRIERPVWAEDVNAG